MPLLTPEQVAVSTCHFTYRNFHLIWTIPQTLILYLLARPFLTPLDYSKLVLLPLIALIWTTPWDSELIRSRAWAYPRDCVLFSVWRIPIEEYFFFIIQSIATVLLTTLFTRWISPVKFILRKQTSNSTVWIGASILVISLGSFMTYASGHKYYMGMILWWSFLPIGFLGYGSSDFIFQIISDGKPLTFLAPLILTSTYLCFADLFALKRGTWVISAHTSLGIDVVPQLPIEECTFFWVTNLIIVTACFAFDRCAAVSRVILPDESNPTSPLSPINFPFSIRSISIMWKSFLYSPQAEENNHPEEKQSQEELTIHDPMFSERILKEASKSFYTASLLLPYDLRADLGSAYSFARVTDDLIDLPLVGESFIKSKEKKLYLLNLLKELIDAIYRQSDHRQRFIATLKLLQDQQHEWLKEQEVMVKLKYAMRSIIELCDLLPKELILELLEGYEMDLDLEEAGNRGEIGFRSQEMLIEYSERVAGSIGEICVRIVLKRLGLETPPYERPEVKSQFGPIKPAASDEDLTEFESLIKEARRMGVALQLVNISRDTSSDVLNLKRCYLPSSMFNEEEISSIKSTLRSSSSSQVKASEESRKGLKVLRRKALDLLSIADSEFAASYPALQRLPCSPARTGLRVACSAYAEIGRAVRIQKEEEALEGVKARPTNLRRLWVVIKALYMG